MLKKMVLNFTWYKDGKDCRKCWEQGGDYGCMEEKNAMTAGQSDKSHR